MEIRESQIEDILISSPTLMQQTLKLEEELRLIGRQIIVPSGRLDMLYAYQKDLFLIELKITAFQKKFIEQVVNYRNDLLLFQRQGKLVQGYIQPFLLLPEISDSNRKIAESEGVLCKEYDPESILKYFYSEKLYPITFFVENKPIDIGIWNIHLINKFIYFIDKINSIKELQKEVGGSPKSLYNKIKFADELGLLTWNYRNDYITLSEIGLKFVIQLQLHKSLKLMNKLVVNYSEGNWFRNPNENSGEPYEVLHEMDLFVEPSTIEQTDNMILGELYFVLVIMGIEYVINMGGNEIEMYNRWLKKNNYKSPIRRGSEEMLDSSIADIFPLLIKHNK